MSSIRPIFPLSTLLPYQAFQQSSAWLGMVFFLMPNNTSLTFDKPLALYLSSTICLSMVTCLAWQTRLGIYLKGGASMISSLFEYWARYAVVWLVSYKGTGAGVKSQCNEGRARSSSLLYTPSSFSGFKLRLSIPALSSPLPRLPIPSNPALLRPPLSQDCWLLLTPSCTDLRFPKIAPDALRSELPHCRILALGLNRAFVHQTFRGLGRETLELHMKRIRVGICCL